MAAYWWYILKVSVCIIVFYAFYTLALRNYVIIQHNETFSTLYSHLKSISVQIGDKLEEGQIIGYAGKTGLATGPHLHYEVFKDGKNVNPMDYLLVPCQR